MNRRRVGLRAERDPAGNLWACPSSQGPGGPSALTWTACARGDATTGRSGWWRVWRWRPARRRWRSSRSPTRRERASTPPPSGAELSPGCSIEDVLDRMDADGVTLADAMSAAGVDPAGIGDAPEWLDRLRGCSSCTSTRAREVAEPAVPARVVRGLAARMRVRWSSGARPTTPAPPARRPPRRAAAAARLIVRADSWPVPGMVTTAGRMQVEPNAPTTVPARVRLWLDARAPRPAEVDAWWAGVQGAADELGQPPESRCGPPWRRPTAVPPSTRA